MEFTIDITPGAFPPTAPCKNCNGPFSAHHHWGCDCQRPTIQEFWKPFDAMPAYMKTREEILAWEAKSPQHCTCRQFEPLALSEPSDEDPQEEQVA